MRTALFLTALLFAVACSREAPDVSQAGPSQSSTTTDVTPQMAESSTMNPALVTETDTPAATPTPAAPAQEVHLIEYSIHMPDTLPAGRRALTIENGGKEKHAFEIEGNGVHAETPVITSGSTTSLDVDLKPGTYTVYCPVKGHKEKGMTKTVMVK